GAGDHQPAATARSAPAFAAGTTNSPTGTVHRLLDCRLRRTGDSSGDATEHIRAGSSSRSPSGSGHGGCAGNNDRVFSARNFYPTYGHRWRWAVQIEAGAMDG